MPVIENVRCVLLSAPYGRPESAETLAFYEAPAHRTTGMVEVRLADGTVGLGEGYLAVLAPQVFREIVSFLGPSLIGKEATDIAGRVYELRRSCDYWGVTGPVRHVTAAFELALVDACARRVGQPAYVYLGGRRGDGLAMYASGGDSLSPEAMMNELESARLKGVRIFKMRSLGGDDVERCAWTVRVGRELGLNVAIDLAQNLASTPLTWTESLAFARDVQDESGCQIAFLEEPVGSFDIGGFTCLRSAGVTRIAGGETLTTVEEMVRRVAGGVYDIAQPDATIMGLASLREVCSAARVYGVATAVHAWGGPVGLAANYHAGVAGGAQVAEYPLLDYVLRDELLEEPIRLEGGRWVLPSASGFGVRLNEDIERRFAFRQDAVCRGFGSALSWDAKAWVAKDLQAGDLPDYSVSSEHIIASRGAAASSA
jgi:L-alanine-DL-glutamate epimerase-like enolase superfamily enzyme